MQNKNSHKVFACRAVTPLLGLILLLVLNGCAARHEAPADEPSAQAGASEHTLVVESSHGTFELEPTVVSYAPETFNDPLESFNRPVFAFNDFMFRNLLIPASEAYQAVLPSVVRQGVSNFFSNIREPLNALNHGLQGNGSGLGTSVSRFLINSTVGLLGLFDPAGAWFEIEEDKATLNQTLASYDMGYGAFLVLPFLGQTDTRNGFSTVVEGIVHPVNLMSSSADTLYIQGYNSFHEFAPQAESYETLQQQSEDPYIFFRNLYLQGVMRDQQFSEKATGSEVFQLNPHSTGHQTPSVKSPEVPDTSAAEH